MKRFWLGIGLLGVLLVAGIWITVSMNRFHMPVSEKLTRAEDAAREERWEDAAALLNQADALWTKHRSFSAAVADHEPMEEIDSLFAQVQCYAALREQAECAAACARLATLTKAMAEAHAVNWWNLM